MKITITKEECINTSFADTRGCPLYKKLKSLYGDRIYGVMSSFIVVRYGSLGMDQIHFSMEEWSYAHYKDLIGGTINHVDIDIPGLDKYTTL
jgi:hypothetical protein